MQHGAPTRGCCGTVETAFPIAVTINPEARVSAMLTGAALGEPMRDDWHKIDIAILNEGFVTGPLAIEAEPASGVLFDLPVHELTGQRRQDGAFFVCLTTVSVADVTLTFRALSAIGGLANHNTIHLLLRAV